MDRDDTLGVVTDTTVAVDGGTIAYTDTGTGNPVVLLHGGVMDRTMWTPQIEDLGRDHRVIAIDARGHGLSSTITGPFRHCDDVAAVLRAADAAPAVLVGLSMGGGTAVDTAVEHPGVVAGLVVSGTGTSDPDFRDPWLLGILAEWERAQEAGDLDGYLDAYVRMVAGPGRSPADLGPGIEVDVRQMARHTIETHLEGAAGGPEQVPDVTARSAGIGVPVLAIAGGADSPDHVRMARELVDRVGDGSMTTLEGTGHHPNMERPAEFDRALRDYLDRLGW